MPATCRVVMNRYAILALVVSAPLPALAAEDGASTPRALARACQAKDGEALWSLATAELRTRWNARADELAGTLSDKELEQAFPPFRGSTQQFDGKALLTASLSSASAVDNPCGPAVWTLDSEGIHEG